MRPLALLSPDARATTILSLNMIIGIGSFAVGDDRSRPLGDDVLTPYDEFPVHQSPYPFSVVPITDYSFDDGYYFGVFSAEEEVFLFQGLRVNPNNDMVGGYAGLNVGGRQYTVRFSARGGRSRHSARPVPVRVVEPFQEVRLTLDANDSRLSFDLTWLATAPAFEEAASPGATRGAGARPTRPATPRAARPRGGSSSTVKRSRSRRGPLVGQSRPLVGRSTTSGRRSPRPPGSSGPRERPAVRRACGSGRSSRHRG